MTDGADPTIENPASNKLPDTISFDDVLETVRKSGYPLQTSVADRLRKLFSIQEEWSFIDSDTNDLRSLDILAERQLYDVADPNKYRVRPELSLLIECKQSDLPYVFFLSPSPLTTFEFPALAGLFGSEVAVKTDDDRSTWHEPILVLLGFRKHPFISNPPNSSVTFSKCVRKGKGFELSGSEAFHGLVMPLVKATKHYVESQRPPATAHYHNLSLTLAVGVLDAPMVGVRYIEGKAEIAPVPWIRVFRHESMKSDERSERARVYAIDVVHKDFLEKYIETYAIPMAEEFAAVSEKHDVVLATLEGFIPGMGKDSWGNLQARLQPRGMMSKVKDAAQKIIIQAVESQMGPPGRS